MPNHLSWDYGPRKPKSCHQTKTHHHYLTLKSSSARFLWCHRFQNTKSIKCQPIECKKRGMTRDQIFVYFYYASSKHTTSFWRWYNVVFTHQQRSCACWLTTCYETRPCCFYVCFPLFSVRVHDVASEYLITYKLKDLFIYSRKVVPYWKIQLKVISDIGPKKNKTARF